MSELLQIQEPLAAQQREPHQAPPQASDQAPQWSAFLELGFRPLYLLACLWAAVAVALWVWAPQWIQGRLSGVYWHAHEMLWAFVASIAVGFLLTAASNWTGRNPLKGGWLAGLCVAWIVARLGFLIPGALAYAVAVSCELLFFAAAALALAKVIYATRSWRNYGLPVLVAALGMSDAMFLRAVAQGEYAQVMHYMQLGLLCMATVALLIARRVIPFFAMRAVPGLQLPMHTRSGQWQLACSVLAIGCLLLGASFGAGHAAAQVAVLVAALALGLAALIAGWQVLAWRPLAVRHAPLLWILYLGYAALTLGLAVAAFQLAGAPLRFAWPVHLVASAGFGLLIIGMVTRTALGHLGRPLRVDRPMLVLYLLVLLAAVLRLLALLPGAWAQPALHAAALAWVLAFAGYGWRFFPMLVRPRLPSEAQAIPPQAAMQKLTAH